MQQWTSKQRTNGSVDQKGMPESFELWRAVSARKYEDRRVKHHARTTMNGVKWKHTFASNIEDRNVSVNASSRGRGFISKKRLVSKQIDRSKWNGKGGWKAQSIKYSLGIVVMYPHIAYGQAVTPFVTSRRTRLEMATHKDIER